MKNNGKRYATKSKLDKPNSIIIEATALELAATWYEIGRGQGMTSKWPNARKYAKANFETFIPKAVEILTEMLGNPNTPALLKEAIYDAITERASDPKLAVLNDPGRRPNDMASSFKLPDNWKPSPFKGNA